MDSEQGIELSAEWGWSRLGCRWAGQGRAGRGHSRQGEALGLGVFKEEHHSYSLSSHLSFQSCGSLCEGPEDRKLWQAGREGAMLKCLSEGQPPPRTTGHV